jgi:hypothetical protein
MLLVGHYWRKSGGPPVWAHATGTYVRYYSGEGTQVTPLIQDIHSSKVYYDPPFIYMMDTRDFGEGMTPERKAERAVVESVINFVFLSTGRLVRTLDLENPDMLGNFRLACKNFYQHRVTNATADRALNEQLLEIKAENEAVQELGERFEAIGGDAGFEHGRRNLDMVIPAKRTFVDLSDDGSDTLTQGEYNNPPIQQRLADHFSRL